MNLVGYTTTALSRNDIIDTPTNKNIVDFSIVELKDYDGNLVTIYDDINGTNPETQKSCDADGQLTFFAEAGDYILEVNGRPQYITISVNITVVNDVSSQRIWGDRYKGELTADAGVTLADEFSVLLYDGNYYSYTGSDPFPVIVASGTVPTAPDYKLKNPTDHELFERPLIIVASGQSNMDGAGDGGEMPDENANVQMFDLETRSFRTLSYTDRIARTNVNNGGNMTIPSAAGKNNLAFSFCHAAHKETGRPVYLIIVSNGGTHIGRWVGTDTNSIANYEGGWGPVGTEKPLYVELQLAVDEALTEIGASKIDAFLWHQGETKRPNFTSPDDYLNDLNTLLGQLRSETWWSDNTQFIAGEQIIGSYYQDSENYNDIWRSFNYDGDPFTKSVSGEGLTMNAVITNPDSVHYDGQSLHILGLRYWRAFIGDKTALASRADAETTRFGATSRTYFWPVGKPLSEPWNIDFIGDRVVESKKPAIPRVGVGGFQAGQRLLSLAGTNVTHNDDGTADFSFTGSVFQDFSVTLEDYHDKWPNISRYGTNPLSITFKVNKEKIEKFRIWLDGDTSASLNVNMTPYLNGDNANANDLLEIDWGDGTVDTGLSTGTHTHTYSPAFTGYVIVKAPAACSITTIISSDGKFRSPLSNFSSLSKLSYISFAADSAMHGDMRDLPDSVVTCLITGSANRVTWDFTGLPNLKNLTAQGLNSINSPSKSAGMNEFTRLILDGEDRTTEQIDNILIALSSIPVWTGTKDIYLNYTGQAARSTASDAAVAILTGKGVTVSTN